MPTPERGDAEPDDDAAAKKKTRKRERRMSVAAHVERVIDATIEVPEAERACCHCGTEMSVFDYAEHERADVAIA